MRRFPFIALTFSLAALCASAAASHGDVSAPAAAAGRARHRLSDAQARQIVILVARHEHIDLSDTHIELNSMDLGSTFISGYSSFILIRESLTPGPDETLRRYAVNRKTGDVWEMTLCNHYDFPALRRLRASLGGGRDASPADLAAQSKELGCSLQKKSPTL